MELVYVTQIIVRQNLITRLLNFGNTRVAKLCIYLINM